MPTAKASLLIRRPPRAVFDAFARADTITHFWLTSTSGPLAPGAVVNWEFMVPGAKETVTVMDFDVGRHIAFTWSSGMTVEMLFEPYRGDATHVSVTVSAFEEKDLLAQVANVVEGFSIVLCDLKTLLEQGRSASLVRDKAELIANSMER
ncbi:MAG: SRPBCC domain-containing protein [Pseudomonadota bacterium]